ncbi:Peptidyl-prolyl cis-trans isomerase B [Wohlfahrtiimonas chitiniclastica SH04]|uniref:Peptidyl-prolyl cis-trans isomerase n=1 Tax=Wohlfahrtiimonas chitiniclastica SH04 TaxID=1261130 RepID=L8XYB8_9GAMM|nr:Peptidyl-prolyl cis-trans isomerase B [Wohlfahrtiimonas chitiniclastica SH04]
MLKRLLTLAGASVLAFQVAAADDAQPIFVEMITNKGNITLALEPEKAPNTVGNFIQYVVDGHYDNLIFHRVIPGFMIQGGGWDSNLVPKETRAPVNIESNNGLSNDKGTIAMARTSDPNSATSQFFINTVDNAYLNYQSDNNPGYTVFGHVVDGMDVVEAIEQVPTSNRGFGRSDVPVEPVIIEKMTLIEAPKTEASPETITPAPESAPAA